MALPTLLSRPEKTVDGALSRWNAAALPIQYRIQNDKWPTNPSEHELLSVSNANGYAQIVINAVSLFVAKDWVYVSGSVYQGPYRVRSVEATDTYTLDTPYISNDSGMVSFYYNNYTTVVNVYAGLPLNHEFNYVKPITLVGTIQQRPNSDNITYVDVRKYIVSKLSTFNDITQIAFPNDLNLFTGFYIEFAERYDSVQSNQVVNFTSAYQSDESDMCFASYSALQFRNPNGGNMADYLLGGSVYKENLTKFMTRFERPTVFPGQYFDISILNAPGNFVFIKEYDINGVELAEQVKLMQANDTGVYRVRLDDRSYNSSTEYITIQVSIPDYLPEFVTEGTVTDDEICITWTNEVEDFDIEIYRDGILIDVVSAGTSEYCDGGLTAETEYCYSIKYVGAVSQSQEICITTLFALQITTNSDPSVANPFDPTIIYSGTGDVMWRFPDGSTVTGESVVVTDANKRGLDGTSKVVRLVVEEFDQIDQITMNEDNLLGSLNLSKLTGASLINLNTNALTSYTNPPIADGNGWVLNIASNNLSSLDVSNVTGLDSSSAINCRNNPNLLLTLPASIPFLNQLICDSCNIGTTLDLTVIDDFAGTFILDDNNITTLLLDTTNTLNLSILTASGNSLSNNINLGSLNFSVGAQLDFEDCGTDFTFPNTSVEFALLRFNGNTIGALDLTNTTGLAAFTEFSSAGVTSIAFPTSSTLIFRLLFQGNTITSITGLANLSGLGEINGAVINFQSSLGTAALVNQVLVQIDSVATGGFSSRTVVIDGTNPAPDTTSGGFNGSAAVTSLISKGYTVETN